MSKARHMQQLQKILGKHSSESAQISFISQINYLLKLVLEAKAILYP